MMTSRTVISLAKVTAEVAVKKITELENSLSQLKAAVISQPEEINLLTNEIANLKAAAALQNHQHQEIIDQQETMMMSQRNEIATKEQENQKLRNDYEEVRSIIEGLEKSNKKDVIELLSDSESDSESDDEAETQSRTSRSQNRRGRYKNRKRKRKRDSKKTKDSQKKNRVSHSTASTPSKKRKYYEGQNKQWNKNLQQLIAYKEKHGNMDDPELADWVKRQRQWYKEKVLSNERYDRLDDIGFVWDLFDAAWNKKFKELITYKETHENMDVPWTYEAAPQLRRWVNMQRRRCRENKLSAERIKQLDTIGFEW